MRRIPLSFFTALCGIGLVSTSASATEDLKLTPPRLIEDLVREEVLLAQDYDEAFDEGEEEEPSGGGSAPQKRRRNRSSSSQQRGSSSSSAGGGYSSFSGGAGGVAPMGKTFGVGLQLGAPTAVTGKFMLTPESGLVVGLGAGYGFFFDPALSLHVDYLYHPGILFQNEGVKMSWFIGGGGWVGLYQSRRYNYVVPGYAYYYGSPLFLAARLPIGISLALQSVPLEFYLEGVPALSIFPVISFGLGLAGGVRFYF